ncbi:hypothetical protein INT80_04190 [Gallibacterium anatis]|uniref:Uncharacterized protein n=1 Tax=Gallibacterium anatis TaxID=750 RepID=A0A930UUD3_9PAST|nr:hypothetical protein [Gallibacterium anatis]
MAEIRQQIQNNQLQQTLQTIKAIQKRQTDVGGQDKDPDTTAPAAPTGLAADNSGTNTVISGKAEPNSKVVIDGKKSIR